MHQQGRFVPPAAILATTLVRFGCDSRTTGSMPTSASSPATCSAASRSPGPEWSPGLDVSILIRSRQMSTTSSCAVTWFAVTVLSSHPGLSPVCRVAPAPAAEHRAKIQMACALA